MDRALSAIAHALRWWFLGQLASMLLLGVTVSIGLLVIGVDVWLSLGVLTALLTFIPFLGPLIAAVPILIVGFAEGTQVFGALGLILAAPLTVVAMVAVNKLYVEDVLGRETQS